MGSFGAFSYLHRSSYGGHLSWNRTPIMIKAFDFSEWCVLWHCLLDRDCPQFHDPYLKQNNKLIVGIQKKKKKTNSICPYIIVTKEKYSFPMKRMMTLMTAGIWPATAKRLPNGYCLQNTSASIIFSTLAAQHNEAVAGPHPKDDRRTLWTLAAKLLLSRLPGAHALQRSSQLLLPMAVETSRRGTTMFPLRTISKLHPLLHDLR